MSEGSYSIKIRELTRRTVTRDRAKEAMKKLLDQRDSFQGKELVLDFSGAESVSGSFLDECVLTLQSLQSSGARGVVFIIDNDEIRGKLQQAVNIRTISVRVATSQDTAPTAITPMEKQNGNGERLTEVKSKARLPA